VVEGFVDLGLAVLVLDGLLRLAEGSRFPRWDSARERARGGGATPARPRGVTPIANARAAGCLHAELSRADFLGWVGMCTACQGQYPCGFPP
jgi:hypothetical protein